jgi:hypothetical protein
MKRVLLLVLAACPSPTKPSIVANKPAVVDESHLLPPLPKNEPVDTAKFAGVIVCARCHQANEHDMRDSRKRDVSPVTEVQAGMHMLSARDPYFLAALRREVDANPKAKAQIEAICLRCHAPVGFGESPAIALDDIVRGTAPAAILAREGVGCAGCHSLDPRTLGKEEGFTGQAPLRTDRISFGALPQPLEEAMLQMSRTKPVPSPHIAESRLCASCHSVFVHRLDASGAPVGDEVAEQATYLEWRNSDYQNEVAPAGDRAATCQDCHMPHGEDELDRMAKPIVTAFSTRPVDAPPRTGYRRHTLRGGNAYMLRQMSKHAAWLGGAATAAQLNAAADLTGAFLASGAKLTVVGVGRELRVTVTNETGHKLPTGYPTRRMWLRVRAMDHHGRVVFDSGRHENGAILDSQGRRIDGLGAIVGHVDRPSADDVPIWEAVPVDAAGNRTHLLLGTARFVKDNRILPFGWRDDHADIKRMKPIGVDGDSDFLPGHDSVMYILPATSHTANVELLYQAVPPETIESYDPKANREAARFRAVAADPPEPSVMAFESVTLQSVP